MAGSLGEQPVFGAGNSLSSDPLGHRFSETFRITRPENWAIETSNFCLPFSSNPKLSFQIRQSSSWDQEYTFPLFNIWRPSYFGISLSQLGSDPFKLHRKTDLIVTAHEDDIQAFKISESDTIRFHTESIIAGIDVKPPPFFGCSVCCSDRGKVFLPNGERWSWIEVDGERYEFERDGDSWHTSESRKSLQWNFNCDFRSRAIKDLPARLPFPIGKYTRVCQIKELDGEQNIRPDERSVAIMNREGFIFLDGMEAKMVGVQSEDNRRLILMTGLAIAQYEGWLAS